MSDMAMKYEDWLRGCVHHGGRKGNVYLTCDTVLAIADWIEAHRDVAPVRHGRWKHERLPSTSGGSYAVVRCSVCEHQYPMNETNYCPNCGARMDKEADENEID